MILIKIKVQQGHGLTSKIVQSNKVIWSNIQDYSQTMTSFTSKINVQQGGMI